MDGWYKLARPALWTSLGSLVVIGYLLLTMLIPTVDQSQTTVSPVIRAELWWMLGCWGLSVFGMIPTVMIRNDRLQMGFRQPATTSKSAQEEPEHKTAAREEPAHPLKTAVRTRPKRNSSLSPQVRASGERLLADTLHSLEKLQKNLVNQPVRVGQGFHLHAYHGSIEHLESQAKIMYNSVTGTNLAVQKTVSRIQRLFRQCRDSANFSATNRLDWKRTTMLGNLSQVRQSHDRVLDTSKNIAAIHASTLRLLRESIQGEEIVNHKIERVQEYLNQVQTSSHAGYKSHDQVTAIIGESKDGVANAAKLVNGMTQKIENLLSLIVGLDEVSEKLNHQALQISVRVSKLSEKDLGLEVSDLRSYAAQFHTVSRDIKELGESVHAEIESSLHHLNDAGNKAETAFASVNQCGELYRNNVSATKYGLSELSLLVKEVGIHMKKLEETRDLGDSAETLMGDLDHLLSGYNEMNKRISEETNQMAAHCDKLSHLLAKQYYELSHCEKMLTDSAGSLRDAAQYATENKQNVASLRAAFAELREGDEASSEEQELACVHLEMQAIDKLKTEIRQYLDKHASLLDKPNSVVPVISVQHG